MGKMDRSMPMGTDTQAAEFVRLEGVDVPYGAQFQYFTNDDLRLRAMLAPARTPDARGSIIFVPGRTEFIEKYFETVEDFQNRGFAVLIIDPRGQGLSDRLLPDPLKCHVEDYSDYAVDLAKAWELFAADLPKPHILLGHSMGGTIGLLSVLSGRVNPAAAVLSAPMLKLHDLDKTLVSIIVRVCNLFGMAKNALPMQGHRTTPLSFKLNKLTSDPNRYQLWSTYFLNHRRLRSGPPTFGWVSASIKAMDFVNDNARHLNIPALFIAAGADPIVVPSAVEDFARKAKADCVNIAGARHEVLIEADEYRDQFWTAFDAFLEKNAF